MFIAYKTNEDTIRVSPGVKNAIRVKNDAVRSKGEIGDQINIKRSVKNYRTRDSNLLEGCQVTVSAPFIMTKNAFIILSINDNQFLDQTYGRPLPSTVHYVQIRPNKIQLP